LRLKGQAVVVILLADSQPWNEERLGVLRELLDTPSPSGFETKIQSLIAEKIRRYVDDVKIDVMGNLIAARKRAGYPRVALFAHCDEIGLMISHISQEGFLYFLPIGMIDEHVTPGRRVTVHSRVGPVLGVVGSRQVGILSSEERTKVVPFRLQWIDIGANSRDEAGRLVSVGDPVTFNSPLERFRDENLIVAREIDDKLGIFIIMEALRKVSEKGEHEAAVFFVSTVQEEIGLRGSIIAAHEIEPHAAFVVDIGWTSDVPDTMNAKQDLGDTRLGAGPIIDKGANNSPVLVQTLLDVAQEGGIPVQLRATPIPIATDAKVIQLSRAGVATVNVNVPARYTHTPSAVASLKDVEYTSELLAQVVLRLKRTLDFTPR
jgi:endoglucanase